VSAHARLLIARAQAARDAPAGAVPSPCNAVCRIDDTTGWCQGCMRTLDEIAGWGALQDPERRAVWRRLEERAAGSRSES
jgi:uncharacterized protein